MTREEAIKILKAIRVYECYPKSASEETKEAIDMAIEALNSVTDSENGAVESKNDVIKRQDAIKTVIRMCSPICDWELEEKAYTDCVIDEINSLPSAEAVEVVRCKECRHSRIEGDTTMFMWCGYWNKPTDGIRYCSDGERREP